MLWDDPECQQKNQFAGVMGAGCPDPFLRKFKKMIYNFLWNLEKL
jgi:hypothetical protein